MVYFPGTQIPAVPAVDPARDTLRASSILFVTNNTQIFHQLCLQQLPPDHVIALNKEQFFFVRGSFRHLRGSVDPLKQALEDFVKGVYASDTTTEFRPAPNIVAGAEITALSKTRPIAPSRILRMHFVIQAATAAGIAAVTAITSAGSTNNGFTDGTVVPSIHMLKAGRLTQALSTSSSSNDDFYEHLASNPGFDTAKQDNFKERLVEAITKPVAYAVTEATANAVLQALSSMTWPKGSTAPTRSELFEPDPNKWPDDVKVKALLQSDGNII